MYSTFLSASTVAQGTWPKRSLGVRDYFMLYNMGIKPSQLTDRTPPLHRETLAVPGTTSAYSLPHNGIFMLEQDPSRLDDRRDAAQLTFKIGPMGLRSITSDGHSEYDLLSISLTGRKRPLIQDPGLYTYQRIGDGTTNNWVRTTNAHNSFTVDDYSHARMDGYFGYSEPRLKPDRPKSKQNGVYVEGWHNGYVNLDPEGTGPRLARTIWHDKDSTFLIVDWAKQKSATPHTYKIAFSIPLDVNSPHLGNRWGVNRVVGLKGSERNGVYTDTSNLAGDARNTGNLLIQPVSVPNHPLEAVACIRATQDADGKTTGPFVTASDDSSHAQPAARFYMTQKTSAANPVAAFVTLLRCYDRSTLGPAQEVDTSVQAKVVTLSDDVLVIDLVEGSTTRRLQFNSPVRAGGSAMLRNANATPMERIYDPEDPDVVISVPALPRTTHTPFPAGMESSRPDPLDSTRGPWIPTVHRGHDESLAQIAGRATAMTLAQTPIVDPALAMLENLL
jgi:hypothetical protein